MAVVLTSESPEANIYSISNSYFQLVIITRIKLHPDKNIWMVSCTLLVYLYFVSYNKNYRSTRNIQLCTDDSTDFIIVPIKIWGLSPYLFLK